MGSMGSVVERNTRLTEHATEEGLPLCCLPARAARHAGRAWFRSCKWRKSRPRLSGTARDGPAVFSVDCRPYHGRRDREFHAMVGERDYFEPLVLIAGFAGRRVILDTIRRSCPKRIPNGGNSRSSTAYRCNRPSVRAFVRRSGEPACAACAILNRVRRAGLSRWCSWRREPTPKCELERRARAAADDSTIFFRACAPLPPRLPRRFRSASRTGAIGGDAPCLPCAGNRAVHFEARAAKQAEAAEKSHMGQRANRAQRASPHRRSLFESDARVSSECHGDRGFADDAAIVAGIGWVRGEPATLIAQEKAVTCKIASSVTSAAHSEGYQQEPAPYAPGRRLGARWCAKWDTQGAFCGKRGRRSAARQAIADNLGCHGGLRVPTVSVLNGRRWQRRVRSRLRWPTAWPCRSMPCIRCFSPEGFAVHSVEGIVARGRGGCGHAHERLRDFRTWISSTGARGKARARFGQPRFRDRQRQRMWKKVSTSSALPIDELLEQRYERFRKF